MIFSLIARNRAARRLLSETQQRENMSSFANASLIKNRSAGFFIRSAAVDRPEIVGFCSTFSADWCIVSVGLLMMISILAVGSVAIALFMASCLAIAWRNPGLAASSLYRYSAILLIPLYAMASTLWSDAPETTLKQGAEFLLSVVCFIILLRRISGANLAGALLGPLVLLCALCLLFQPSALHGEALHGFIGSKNYFAFLAQLLVASALATVLDTRYPASFRMFAAAGLALGVLDVVLARSAGAWITAFVSALAYCVLRYSEQVTLAFRASLLIAVGLICAPVAFVYRQIGEKAQIFQRDVLHKDTTLSGRTGLWRFSHSLIAERPVLGHGFSAFWRQGNLDAEGLWRMLGITARGGINFHNQFIEVTVDFGYVGLTLFIVALAWIAVTSLWRALTMPDSSTAFMAALLISLYSRLPVESTLIAPWGFFTLIWVATAIHARAPRTGPDLALPGHREKSQWRFREAAASSANR